MADTPLEAFRGKRPYFGDLHNHCDISYGRGSMDEAWANAKLQLDLASVTGHAPGSWAERGTRSSPSALKQWSGADVAHGYHGRGHGSVTPGPGGLPSAGRK